MDDMFELFRLVGDGEFAGVDAAGGLDKSMFQRLQAYFERAGATPDSIRNLIDRLSDAMQTLGGVITAPERSAIDVVGGLLSNAAQSVAPDLGAVNNVLKEVLGVDV